MTEENTTETTAVISVPQTDMLLAILISLSELGIGIPVTLFVKGTIITGTVISFEDYMKKIATDMRNSINQTGLDQPTFQKVTSLIAESFDTMRTAWTEQDRDKIRQTIHLTNVQVLDPASGKLTVFSNAFWRGSLGSIDGVILGTIDQTSQR